MALISSDLPLYYSPIFYGTIFIGTQSNIHVSWTWPWHDVQRCPCCWEEVKPESDAVLCHPNSSHFIHRVCYAEGKLDKCPLCRCEWQPQFHCECVDFVHIDASMIPGTTIIVGRRATGRSDTFARLGRLYPSIRNWIAVSPSDLIFADTTPYDESDDEDELPELLPENESANSGWAALRTDAYDDIFQAQSPGETVPGPTGPRSIFNGHLIGPTGPAPTVTRPEVTGPTGPQSSWRIHRAEINQRFQDLSRSNSQNLLVLDP